jgi:hypothetical protein
MARPLPVGRVTENAVKNSPMRYYDSSSGAHPTPIVGSVQT